MTEWDNVSWKSFDTWFQDGFTIKKGEKSILRCPITNKGLFHSGQVIEVDI